MELALPTEVGSVVFDTTTSGKWSGSVKIFESLVGQPSLAGMTTKLYVEQQIVSRMRT